MTNNFKNILLSTSSAILGGPNQNISYLGGATARPVLKSTNETHYFSIY